jgi:aldehyde dehydrogenase (NAD+)
VIFPLFVCFCFEKLFFSKATLVTGGTRKGDSGYFINPTIFGDVQAGHKIHDEEIFGPVCLCCCCRLLCCCFFTFFCLKVVCVSKFSTLDDAVFKANNTIYGLGAAVFTKDSSKAIRVAHAIKAGTVWVNTYHQYHESVPFGGYKQSGLGREKGFEAIENYLQTKSV